MRPHALLARRPLMLAAAALLQPASRGRAASLPQNLTVFAAASLTEALASVVAVRQSHEPRPDGAGAGAPRFSFASSGVLARQIDQGAPADLFLSADEKWMDWLEQRGKLVPGTRRDLLGNQLVLVERKAGLKPLALTPGADLPALLGGGRLAVGDPAQVPAGIYAKQALTALGLWEGVKNRLAPAENVRSALLLVERGEAPAGIVYASDVRAAPGLAIAGVFPPASHPPITYPGAVLRSSAMQREAAGLLSFLAGGTAQAIFRDFGFTSAA